MVFSSFIRSQEGNIIFLKNDQPIQHVKNIKYYKDDASGSFAKKELRWSFNKNYWSSWEPLNQGNISSIDINKNPTLFLEIRYTTNNTSANVNTFKVDYNQYSNSELTPCPVSDDTISTSATQIPTDYASKTTCSTSKTITNADTLCGQTCDYYLWRGNHKGQQSINTITDLSQSLTILSEGINNSITNGANVPNGIGVFYDKVGQDLLFKSLDASKGIELYENDGIITISLDASSGIKDPSVNELFDLYYELADELIDISIYIDAEFIKIDSSINDLYLKDASSLKGAKNIGIGTGEIYKEVNSNILELRTIQAGNDNVIVETDGDQITISLDASASGAPIWTDEDPISADVGGWSGGDDVPIDSNSIDILEKMLYEYFPLDVSMGLIPTSDIYYEKWIDVFTIDISGNFNNDKFTKSLTYDASLYVNDAPDPGFSSISYPNVSTGSFEWNDSSPPYTVYWDDIKYTVKLFHKVNSIDMEPTQKSSTIKFVEPYYYGTVDNNVNASNITAADIQSLSKLIIPKQNNYITYDVSANYTKIKFVYAYPYDYGSLKSIQDIKNDFNVTSSFDETNISLTIGLSNPINYKVYIKNHWISFNPDVSLFKLDFNI